MVVQEAPWRMIAIASAWPRFCHKPDLWRTWSFEQPFQQGSFVKCSRYVVIENMAEA